MSDRDSLRPLSTKEVVYALWDVRARMFMETEAERWSYLRHKT